MWANLRMQQGWSARLILGKNTPHNFETRSEQIWKHATIVESMEEQLLDDPSSNQH